DSTTWSVLRIKPLHKIIREFVVKDDSRSSGTELEFVNCTIFRSSYADGDGNKQFKLLGLN
ncbi:hypothetical protein FRX31_005428, partial [Thalictrum thalictroides]